MSSTSRERMTQAEQTAKVRESMARYADPAETLNQPLSVAPDKAKRATLDGYSLTRSGVLHTADDITDPPRRSV